MLNIEEESISKRNRFSRPNHSETNSSTVSISDLFNLVKQYTAFMHKFYAVIRIDGNVCIAKMSVDESYLPGQTDTHKKFYHVRYGLPLQLLLFMG